MNLIGIALALAAAAAGIIWKVSASKARLRKANEALDAGRWENEGGAARGEK